MSIPAIQDDTEFLSDLAQLCGLAEQILNHPALSEHCMQIFLDIPTRGE